ncbi:Tetratricopeptide repeat 1 [Micractinium conductrix]|uniref:Tetratricopeptide repeat 1 n=1 Tax=Micractinium conductrix TaxID=554055 RepID=A0A2P6V3J7_9CHLO|nr:Tetratricopeptide repeat 1 [Micractinium conductrix]|eukprot:PSC68655.1 Tetratricopeptide repeat 1 [Micractinium conductrix]
MVVIEDITEQEAAREAAAREAERAAAAAAAAAAEEQRRLAAEAQTQAAAAAAAQHAAAEDGGEAAGRPQGAAEPAAGSGAAEGDAAAISHAAPSQPAERSDADKEQLVVAEGLKKAGNEAYAGERWEEALDKYAAALEAAPEAAAAQRSVYHCNRAAAHLKLGQWAEAAQECSAALELQEGYTKALLRRSTAYEKLDDLERALADAQKVLELEPGQAVAAATVKRLTPVVEERREKLKDEMMGKLKELGNMVLGKFGLSVDNFKTEQDPSTGSYSIKFQQ